MAVSPKPGDKAPAFNLTDQHGDKIRLPASRAVTCSCTSIRRPTRPAARPRRAGCATSPTQIGDTVVLGISPDCPSQARRSSTRSTALGFTLLSDPDHAIADAVRRVGRQEHVRRYHGHHPLGLPVDEKGKISHAWPKISPKDTPKKLLEALAET